MSNETTYRGWSIEPNDEGAYVATRRGDTLHGISEDGVRAKIDRHLPLDINMTRLHPPVITS